MKIIKFFESQQAFLAYIYKNFIKTGNFKSCEKHDFRFKTSQSINHHQNWIGEDTTFAV